MAYLWTRGQLHTRLICMDDPTTPTRTGWSPFPHDLPEDCSAPVPWINLDGGLRLSTEDFRTFMNERPSDETVRTALARARERERTRCPELFSLLDRPDLATLDLLRAAWKNQTIRTPLMTVTSGGWRSLMAGNAPAEHAGSAVFVIRQGHLERHWTLPPGVTSGGPDGTPDTPLPGETRMLLHHSAQPAHPVLLLAVTLTADQNAPGTRP